MIIPFDDKESLDKIQENEIPFFFANFVTTIDQMHGLIKYHPTDMYICEELGFFLDKISKILHDNDIKVRVFPNICQSSFKETPSIKTFFIRPDDIDVYSEYVDVFEIVSDQDRQGVLLKIYRQGYWEGMIREVIPSFKDNFDSKYILTNFGSIRSKCGKRCLYKTGSCNICDRLREVAETFKENKLMIKKAVKKN